MDTKKALLDHLEESIRQTGRDLGESSKELRAYAAEQMAQLSLGIGQPGYADALIAARDNLALKAAVSLADNADAADQRLVGTMQTVLTIGAMAVL